MMTTHEPSLSQDLGILAAEDRDQLGEPPTAEQLIALRDGKLPEEEAERLRDLLAVDPEWASIYLELKSPVASEDSDDAGEVDVDGAWDRLSRRMKVPSIEDRKGNVDRPGAVPARETIRRFLPLAAGLFLGLGLVWAITNQPTGEFHVVGVTGEGMRSSSTVELPRHSAGLVFQIEISPSDQAVDVDLRLTDFQGTVVQSQRATVATGQQMIEFRIPTSALKDGWTYELTVAFVDSDSPPIEKTFELVIR